MPVSEDLLKLMVTKKLNKTVIKDFEIPCAICMKDYEENDRILITPCEHNYHFECISDWFRKHNQCPICKFRIVKENLCLKPNHE